MASYPELMAAMKAISARCDGAHAQDGAGFNGTDSSFGKSLASQSSWSPLQAKSAYRMLAKYRKQLQLVGIDYDSIPNPATLSVVPTSSVAPKQRCITVEDGEFWLDFELDWALNSKIKTIVGRRWDGVKSQWHIPLSSAKQVAEFAQENNFEVSAEVRAIFEAETQKYQATLQASGLQDADFDVEINGEPRPYQRAGAKYLVDHQRAFLADDMGTGKTIQSIMAVKYLKAFPTIVICPASVKLNWEREIKRWVGASTFVINGKPDKQVMSKIVDLLGKKPTRSAPKSGDRWSLESLLNDTPLGMMGSTDNIELVLQRNGVGDYVGLLNSPDFVVINYDIVSHWLPVLTKFNFQAMIADESTYLKNNTTKRVKGVKELSHSIPYRFLLSGTPMLSRPAELISQLQILDRLQDFGGWKFFTQRYCNAQYNGYGLDLNGSANTQELGEMLRATCMVRRTKKDVLKELPDKQRSYIYLPLEDRREYEKAEHDIVSWVGQEAARDEEFKTSIAHLPLAEYRAALSEYINSAEARAARAEHLVKIEKLKMLSAEGKYKAFVEWVQEFLETDEKLIVFAWHKDIIDRLAKHFDAPSITGDTPIEKRQEYIDRFQNDPNCRLIICNIQAGGMGITLTAASNVAIFELGWTPGQMQQAEDRSHRLGQKNAVNVWYMLGEDTIDEDISELIQQKSKIITEIVGGETTEGDQGSVLGDIIERLRQKSVEKKAA